jgi:hypothetical protein
MPDSADLYQAWRTSLLSSLDINSNYILPIFDLNSNEDYSTIWEAAMNKFMAEKDGSNGLVKLPSAVVKFKLIGLINYFTLTRNKLILAKAIGLVDNVVVPEALVAEANLNLEHLNEMYTSGKYDEVPIIMNDWVPREANLIPGFYSEISRTGSVITLENQEVVEIPTTKELEKVFKKYQITPADWVAALMGAENIVSVENMIAEVTQADTEAKIPKELLRVVEYFKHKSDDFSIMNTNCAIRGLIK